MSEYTYPTLTGYMSGCNLGHWLSQYGSKGEEHWSSYIVESDFARIASWGMDHVRLPVDYMLFEADEKPGEYREDRLAYIDNAIAWAGKHGIHVVLDLHHAPGFFFGDGNRNDLLTNPASQRRFIAIWEMFARRYIDIGDRLRFELLNELVCDDIAPWNDLWQRTAAAIHRITPERGVIVGGNYNNQVFEMENLTYVDDPHIFYTFHMYEPFLFTHQQAGWSDSFHASYTKPVAYPYRFEDHRDYYYGRYGTPLPPFFASLEEEKVIDRAFVEKFLAPAVEFIQAHNRPVYLGEYGVIHNADDESAIRWYNDIADLCIRYGIGRAVWSYRGFANITDGDNNVRDPRMVEAISRQK